VVFLGYPDGEVYNTPDLRRDLVRQIRLHRPDLVVTHDPTARFIGHTWINHPDHRAVGDTALDAVFPLARDRLNFPEHEREGLAPHKVLNVFLTPTNEPNEWVDISATLDLKISALWEHRSQIGDPEALAARIRQRAQDYAEGTPFAYAERFRRINLR
jgi:LmbE family N-acetylglucosaminyl deacetylase